MAEVPPRLELAVSAVVERAPGATSQQRRHAFGSLFRAPTALTTADTRIERLARAIAVDSDDIATAEAYCRLVKKRIRYAFDASDVKTNAAQALTIGTGVCQDQAHLMLALCRAGRIAARYISGHLVGQGGTHAWVEALVATGVIALDPCHGRRADERYVTVAAGEARDVPPTSGSYLGSAFGRLTTARRLDAVESAAA